MEDELEQFWSQGYKKSILEEDDNLMEEPNLRICSESQGDYVLFEDLLPEDINNLVKSGFLPSFDFESHPPPNQELILEEDKHTSEKPRGDSRGKNTSIEDLCPEKNKELSDIGLLQNIKMDPPSEIIEDIDPTPLFTGESHIHPDKNSSEPKESGDEINDNDSVLSTLPSKEFNLESTIYLHILEGENMTLIINDRQGNMQLSTTVMEYTQPESLLELDLTMTKTSLDLTITFQHYKQPSYSLTDPWLRSVLMYILSREHIRPVHT
jgi:hypothetical protein